MEIFMAITDPDIFRPFIRRPKSKLNIMISYHYLRGAAYKVAEKYRHDYLVYLDSGAFSASQGKSSITLPEYRG